MPKAVVFFLGPLKQSPRMMNHIYELSERNYDIHVISYGVAPRQTQWENSSNIAFKQVKVFNTSGWAGLRFVEMAVKIVILSIWTIREFATIDTFPDIVIAQVQKQQTIRCHHFCLRS